MPPDWSLVPFDVHCGRCGQDLRNVTSDACPKCGLPIDWQQAVPIEQLRCESCGYQLLGLTQPRCPECGRDFTWEGALLDLRRRRSMLFEYRWRDRPLGSFLWTWSRSLRPAKFWRSISINDPPRPSPLISYVSLLVWLSVALVVLGEVARALAQFAWWLGGWPNLPWWALVLQELADASLDPATWGAGGRFAAYVLASWAALLIFRQSMRRYRVLPSQVARACVYSVPVLIPMYCIVYYAQVFLLHTTLKYTGGLTMPSWRSRGQFVPSRRGRCIRRTGIISKWTTVSPLL